MNSDPCRPFIKNVAIFGDANVPKSDPVYKSAFAISKRRGSKVYTFDDEGGPGVIDEATSGAKEGGGGTLTVTFTPDDAPGYEGKYVGNVPDKEIVTTNYVERMLKLIEHGDIFVIFKGGTGTISEFGTAWVLAKLYYGHHKPFILYGSFWAEIIDVLKKNLNIDKTELSVFEICHTPEEVIKAIEMFDKRIAKRDHSEHCQVCEDKAFMA